MISFLNFFYFIKHKKIIKLCIFIIISLIFFILVYYQYTINLNLKNQIFKLNETVLNLQKENIFLKNNLSVLELQTKKIVNIERKMNLINTQILNIKGEKDVISTHHNIVVYFNNYSF